MKKEQYSTLIRDLSDRQLLLHLYVTQVLLLVISTILGFLLFDSTSSFLQLFQWNDLKIVVVGGGIGIVVVLIDLVLTKKLPSSYYDDGGLNERIFQNRSVSHIALIASLVSVSEELLFRGILQTHFGLLISSALFALVHYRYLFNWFLFLNITLLSFLMGYIYSVTDNLLVTIVMHFVIDFLLGIYIKYSRNRKGYS
jgi:uncharacterized protein